MNFSIITEDVNIELIRGRGESMGFMQVNFSVEASEILSQMDADEIVRGFDGDSLLSAIGKQAAIEYWNLED